MTRLKTSLGATIAAAAGIMLVACSSTGQPEMQNVAANAVEANVHCMGANACKAQTECKSALNSCKGKNACKGQGWVKTVSKADCELKRGTVM